LTANKQHDLFEKQDDLENFLDHIEAAQIADGVVGQGAEDVVVTDDAVAGRSSIAVVLMRLFVSSIVLVALLTWLFWPDVQKDDTRTIIAQSHQMPEQFDVIDTADQHQHSATTDVKQLKPEKVEKQSAKDPVIIVKKEMPNIIVLNKEFTSPVKSSVVVSNSNIFQVSVNLANIRSAPMAKADIVARLKKGAKVLVIKRQGDWYQIRFHKTKLVWVYHTLLEQP